MTNEELAGIIKNDNATECMELLWSQNQNFVQMLAKRYCTLVSEEELLQEGFIGLVEAAKHYDQNSETGFLSYAGYWVKQRMLQCVSDRTMVHVPAPKYAYVQKYQKIMDEIALSTGRTATEKEIKDILGVNEEFITEIRKNVSARNILSLDVPLEGFDGEVTVADVVADDTDIENDVCKNFDTENMEQELWQAIENLPEEQAEVLKARYVECRTFKETGEKLGIDERAVVKAKNEALRHLRSPRYKKIRAYYEAYICPSSVHHVGVSTFRTTWTSTVEKQAIEHLEGWE